MFLRRDPVKNRLEEPSFPGIGAVLPPWRLNYRSARKLVKLPVECNTSRWTKAQLLKFGIVRNQEVAAVSKALRVAAMKHVAAMVGAVMPLLQIILFTRGDHRG